MKYDPNTHPLFTEARKKADMKRHMADLYMPNGYVPPYTTDCEVIILYKDKAPVTNSAIEELNQLVETIKKRNKVMIDLLHEFEKRKPK